MIIQITLSLWLFFLLPHSSLCHPAIRAHSYDLSFRLPLPDDKFNAAMVLHFSILAPISNFTLDISPTLTDFQNVTLVTLSNPPLPMQKPIIETSNTSMRFLIPQYTLPVSEYILTIASYTGQITTTAKQGIFRPTENSPLILTHLQPAFARTVFPCFDHPSSKAVFRVSLLHPTTSVSVSNTITSDVQLVDPHWQRTVFASSPLLPTYLLAFAILPDSYHQISRQTSFGVTIRVHSNSLDKTRPVLDAAVLSFEALAALIQIELPLNKIDIIITPNYEGMMENWALVIMSEKYTEETNRAQLIYAIAHELAHHWIGNRVTVNNWQHICLQEDLTDVLAMKVVEKIVSRQEYEALRLSQYVEIQLAEQFISPNHSLMMPQEIDQHIMNTHCYLKGVTMLESIESLVGESFFLSVLRNIVATRQWFDLDVFAEYFTDVIIENTQLKEIILFWFNQPGFPSVYVNESRPIASITQSVPLWPLPLHSHQYLPLVLFSQTVSFPLPYHPFIVNANFSSFYRVNYDPSTWNAIFDHMALDLEQFTPTGRAQLVNDFCYFAAHNEVPNADRIRSKVFDIVYSAPASFELCDFSLYWCLNSTPSPTSSALLPSLLRSLAVQFSSFVGSHTPDSSYACRSGHMMSSTYS
ncbi:hypothetical protein WR25_14135 [Diploscapter pachys]|uniref:Uncharacterized protein n=1 Tax=Diploscapter pachys TaxID=2018661 RepID=A0A2A2KPU5_9BILA|nr:hypothetical protein WR25_14135 [Diploscapter pachys]